MALADVIEDKKSVFQRPTAKKDIIKDRKVITVDRFEDIVPALEHRKSYEAIIISPEVNIIPVNERGVPKFYSAQNFSKRGPLVRLKTFSQKEMIEREWAPVVAREEACKRYQNRKNNRYVGWLWWDQDNYAHIVHPSTVLEGHRLDNFALKSRNIENKVRFPKSYHAHDSDMFSVRALVPSRSERKHTVIMENLTRLKNPKRFSEWTRFQTRHECPLKREDFSFKYKRRVTYCPHDVCAHAAYSRRVAERSRIVPVQPFPLFSEPTLRLYLSLINDTMKVETHRKNGKVRTRTKPLSFTEMDPILMSAWLTYGNQDTFYAKGPSKGYKRMRDYDWSPSSPGMPFKK